MGRLTHLTMAEGQPAQLLVQSTCGRTIVMDIPRSEWTKENRISVNSIVKLVVDVEGIPQSAIRLTSGSKDMRPNQELTADEVRALPTVRILLGLAGGKGGFGAMLRNLGKNIDTKNMNYDACRDLSGRRMRHVSNEKKLKDWFHHQEDREKEEKQTKDDAKKKFGQEKAALRRELLDNEAHDLVEETNAVTQVLGAAVRLGLKKRKASEKDPDDVEPDAEASDLGSDEDLFGDVQVPAKKARLGELEAEHQRQVAKQEAAAAAAAKVAAAEEAMAAAAAEAAAAPEAESSEAATGTTKRGRSDDDEAPQPIDLQKVESEQALVDLGMAQLAAACRLRGLKAGGTAAERAQRLWAIKGPPELSGDDVPATLRAGKKKGKK